MSYLLHIDGTLFDSESISRQVARTFRENWNGRVVHRDLAASPVPHLTAPGLTARLTDPATHTSEIAAARGIQDELIDEFLGAGGYLFTVPLYNYGVPSAFKAWIDQVAVVGRTIAIPDGVPARGRPALVVSSRGGAYMEGASHYGRDHLVPHLETILGLEMGLDLTFITPSFGLAPVVPPMADLIPMHEASLAESHEQARKLGESFSFRPGAAA
ncbi:FMN-dependent NADH-azoreductase [Catenuloplanes indicus]|uniref:FMN dependent NADH:quinone oxidoreductase n=1 Tax=Catenuloplanes indicus TaxID=137267 RepID=A0AAE3W4C9_9ACTN|nr:NAD(P)H-dependent oxidoreductase [Catenuloplanes indicus]MDQ0369351.1 FMN-dependent NADH-azoreductase [Catenuloplanes indicus]